MNGHYISHEYNILGIYESGRKLYLDGGQVRQLQVSITTDPRQYNPLKYSQLFTNIM